MKNCPSCGSSNRDGSKYCGYCGVLLSKAESGQAGSMTDKWKKMIWDKKILIVAVIVIALVTLVLFVGKRNSSKARYAVGAIVSLGHYEQDNNLSNGKEPIEWIVLANDGKTATLISRYGLDAKLFNETYAYVTWESCTLRQWLNRDFLNQAFSSRELAKLQTVLVTPDKNPRCNTYQGSETWDRVYLLSIQEADRLFATDKDRQCLPTAYAVAHRAFQMSENGNTSWWLRSSGDDNTVAADVGRGGAINDYGDPVDNLGGVAGSACCAVRPVIVVEID